MTIFNVMGVVSR